MTVVLRAASSVLIGLVCFGVAPSAQSAAVSHPPELVALSAEFRKWRSDSSAAIADLGARAEAQKKGVADFKRRLEALKIDAWPVHAKVDYLVLRSDIDDLDFDLRVIREVSRNPDFYSGQAISRVRRHIGGQRQQGARCAGPVRRQARRGDPRGARARPRVSSTQGPKNLTEAVGGMADMAIERLEDVRKNYNEFARIVGQHMPEPYKAQIGPAADEAGAALEKYREWIVANRAKMTAPTPSDARRSTGTSSA